MEPSSLSTFASAFGASNLAFGLAFDGSLNCAQPTSAEAPAQGVSDFLIMLKVMKRSPGSAAAFKNLEVTLIAPVA